MFNNPTFEASWLNKSLHLDATFGVTKFIILVAMNLATRLSLQNKESHLAQLCYEFCHT